MKIAATITIHAGGPGSGCRGDHCGRHPEAGNRPSIAHIVSIDFDDTIAKHHPGNRYAADPLPNGLKLLHMLHDKGYTVLIHTARHDLKWVQNWLNSHGVGFATAGNKKIGSVAFLDDRAVNWTGNQSVEKAMNRITQMTKARLVKEREENEYAAKMKKAS